MPTLTGSFLPSAVASAITSAPPPLPTPVAVPTNTVDVYSSVGQKLKVVKTLGDSDVPTLTWDTSFVADSTFASVSVNAAVVGDLKSASGKAATNVTFTIASLSGKTFDVGQIYVGVLADIDGTVCETAVIGLNLTSVSASSLVVPQYNGSRIIQSIQGAGFRFCILNKTGVALSVAVKYKQA